MQDLSAGQRQARYGAYDLAADLVDHAMETVTNEAIFTDEEAAENLMLLTEAHDTLKKRMREFAPETTDET